MPRTAVTIAVVAPFIELAKREGVSGAVAARDGAFGDYSQAPREEQPNRANVIRVKDS